MAEAAGTRNVLPRVVVPPPVRSVFQRLRRTSPKPANACIQSVQLTRFTKELEEADPGEAIRGVKG